MTFPWLLKMKNNHKKEFQVNKLTHFYLGIKNMTTCIVKEFDSSQSIESSTWERCQQQFSGEIFIRNNFKRKIDKTWLILGWYEGVKCIQVLKNLVFFSCNVHKPKCDKAPILIYRDSLSYNQLAKAYLFAQACRYNKPWPIGLVLLSAEKVIEARK